MNEQLSPDYGYHDIGGDPSGPVERHEPPLKHWEKVSEAVRALLHEEKRKYVSLDEIRRSFENFGPDLYERLDFYERRTEAMLRLLYEKNLLQPEEVAAKVAEIRQRLGL